MTRRLVAVVAAILVVVGLATTVVLLWPQSDAEPGTIEGRVDDLQAAGVTYFADDHLFVVATPDGFIALWDDARHVGNRALYCTTDDTFLGGYGERFDRQGRYLAGPARGDMGRFPVGVADNTVTVAVSGNPQLTARTDLTSSTVGPSACTDAGEDPPGFYNR